MAKAKKLPSGAWRVLVYSHTDIVDGKKIRRYESFTHEDKREAEYQAAEFMRNKGRMKSPSKLTVGEAIDTYISSNGNILSPATISGYRKIKRNHFADIMDTPINKLTNDLLSMSVSNELARPSKRYKGEVKPLSAKTIKNAYGLLVSVLKKYAPNLDTNVKLPSLEANIKEPLSPDAIYAVVKDTEIELPVLMAMWLSLSMSEIRGVTKSKSIRDGYITVKEVVVDAENVAVRKTKAKTSTRTRRLKIPPYIQSLIDKTNPDEDILVPLSGQAIYKRWSRLLEKNELPHMTFHDLRHVNASVMAQLRIPDKYAMERGGWKTDKVMKSVYQHTFSDYREEVDAQIDEYFSSFIDSMQHEMQHEK